jgi:tRNA(Ile)-lysidine synthase
MDDFAHEIGADIILTGHTRDDQIETVLMRSLRQSAEGDGRGLSGMARRTWLYGGRTIIRPLLGETRQGLREYLARVPQSWIEDPSNVDESYERVRLRKSLLKDPQKGMRVERLAAASARLRRVLSNAVAAYLAQNCESLPGPVYRLPIADGSSAVKQAPAPSDGPSAEAGPGPVFEQAVQVLVAMAGGQAYLISRKRLAMVIEMIRDMMKGQGTDAKKSRLTIGGAVIECSRGTVCFYRETRNLSSVLLEPGETAIWDGRMHIFNGTALPIFVEPADRSQIREYEENRGEKYDVPRRAALWSTPVVHVQTANGGTAPCLPLVEGEKLPKGLDIRLASPAIEHFCPEQDEALCNWVQSMNRYTAASLQP